MSTPSYSDCGNGLVNLSDRFTGIDQPLTRMSANDVVEFTAELVRQPSVLGNEGAAAKAVAERMEALKFDRVEIDEAGNAVGVIEGAGDGPTVVLDGHIDTVDIVPREAWTSNPFGAEISDGRMYGRGTSDMKGAAAAMVCGAALVDRANLRGRVVVSASVGEEWIEGRALKHVLDRYPADYVVIGEASELDVIRGGRGRAEFVLTTMGRAAHASTPALGDNAVHRMLEVIREIEAMPTAKHPETGPGVMALTDIVSKPYPGHSVVPSRCRVTYERRLVPGETREALLGELGEVCRRAGSPDTRIDLATLHYRTYTGIEWRQPKWFSPWILPDDAPAVERARAGLEQAGFAPRLRTYQFCTNAAYSAGVAGIPTIGYGPSSESLAHITDEYIEIDELEKAVEGYRAIIEALLADR